MFDQVIAGNGPAAAEVFFKHSVDEAVAIREFFSAYVKVRASRGSWSPEGKFGIFEYRRTLTVGE